MTNKPTAPKWIKRITIEKVILVLAASFAAYNFSLAGGYIERGTVSFSPGGLIAGVVVNVSIAIAASRFGGLRGDKRIAQARIALIAMMALSPLIIAPIIYASLPNTFLAIQHADLWYLHLLTALPRLAWSIAWPLIADLAIVLTGAVIGKGLISLGADSQPANATGQTAKPARKGKQSSAQTSQPAPQPASATLQTPQAAKVYSCNWPGCEWTTEHSEAVKRGGDPQAALAAHVSHHNRAVRKIEAEKQKVA